eukprot:m.54682 g.54682  ORF g.54682 m.54682 type:complete len:87 (+) comp34389_c0_seq3:579-839(+)
MERSSTNSLQRCTLFSILWSAYEPLTRQLRLQFDGKSQLAVTPMAAAISAAGASVITHPFDVVKTHHQMTVGELEDGECGSNPQNV